MGRLFKNAVFAWVFTLFFHGMAVAGIEPYENFIKGKVKRTDTLIVKDEKFKNPHYNWSDITNISVNNAISFRIVDEALLTQNFSCLVKLKVEYLTQPGQAVPATFDTELKVNYSKEKGATYKVTDSYSFQNAYWVRVIVENIYSPEYGNELPPAFQLTNSIVIDRQYRFKKSQSISPNSAIVGPQTSGVSPALKTNTLFSLIGGSGSGPVNNGAQLQLTWAVIPGAEEYDIEWATVNDGNPNYSDVQQMANGSAGTVDPAILEKLFLHNSSRMTTQNQNALLSLVYNDSYIVVRMRQVQYATDGLRLLGSWDYKQDNGKYNAWGINWFQQNINWQYSSTFAEDGKKKEVVNFYDGSLRDRQIVTINNSDNVPVVQESIYDDFGRPTAAILPAPVKEATGVNAFLRYFKDFNVNSSNKAYNADNVKGGLASASCEFNPDLLKTSSGASLYYSPQNTFVADKIFNKFIPDAEGFPLSVKEFTADNTGRVKTEGGVGKMFQPGRAYPSKTTKYYYGKPEQWELDQLFGNDVGYASHYLKNMIVDPNGQTSISYLNSGGKVIATALTGPAPAGMDSLSSIVPAKVVNINLLDPSKFIFDNAALKISAATTYLASMNGPTKLIYNVQQIIDRYPGGSKAICSNCYFDMTIKVLNDCNTVIYYNTSPIQIGSKVADCNEHADANSSFNINFPQIGEYYITMELAFSRTVMESYVDQFVVKGQENGALRKSFSFIQPHLDSIDFKGCLSDCKTAVAILGEKNDFIDFFKAKLLASNVDPSDVNGSAFGTWVSRKYDLLKLYCDSIQAQCSTHPSVPVCNQYESLMLTDVSPGGQYALFDNLLQPVEPTLNVLNQHWRTEFPVQTNAQALYQSELITLPDGSVTSPYDSQFTVAMLVQYWKADWAAKFLKYHPEFCKLEFCMNTSSYKQWDDLVQNDIQNNADIVRIPNAPQGFQYDRSNAGWLLAADPFFQTGAPGASYRSQIAVDIDRYSFNILKNSTSSIKGLTFFVDYLLYCSDVTGTLNTSKDPNNNWDNCVPAMACRVPDREWSTYKDLYFDLKQRYYEKVREATTCVGSCAVGTPLSLPSNSTCPANNDFNIALYSSADGPPVSVCNNLSQTVSLRYVPGAAKTGATVTLSYPEGADITGLQTIFHFSAGDERKIFCVPLTIPLQSIVVNSVLCENCEPDQQLFNTWTNDHIVQTIYDSNNNIVSSATLLPGNNGFFNGRLTIKPDNTYDASSNYGSYSANWEMDSECQFALYSRGIKYTLKSIAGQQLALKHREDNVEETWYLNGEDLVVNCTSPDVLNVTAIAGNKTYYTGTYPARHLLTLVQGMANQTPAFNCSNTGNQVTSTAHFYSCLNIHTPSATTSYQNVWVFDCLYDSAPANCPAAYLTKISRFEDVDRNIVAADLTSSGEMNVEKIAAQAQSSCEASADGWIAALSPGLSGYQPSDVAILRAKLIEICAQGGDLDHPFGASSVAQGQVTPSGFTTFGDAIINVLHLSSFSSQLNPWLIGSPYPYSPKMQVNSQVIISSNSAICAQLESLQQQADQYNTANGTSLSLFQYLKQFFGTAMTLSTEQLTTLQESCTQCRFLLKYDIALPVFLQPGAKGCVLPAEYIAAKSDLQTKFGPSGIPESDANYQVILTNFLNQRWGFALSFDQYKNYETELISNPGKTLCNSIAADIGTGIDLRACISEQISTAVANGSQEYNVYIEIQKNLFRNSYVSTCSAAQANLNLYASQKTYHYTLYYYDQAGNLTRTIPAEGVSLLPETSFPAVANYRNQYAFAADALIYDYTKVHLDKTAALDNLSVTLRPDSVNGSTIEMWLYNPNRNGNQIVATTPDHRFLFQTCIQDTVMSVDVLKLDTVAINSIVVQSVNRYSFSVAKQTPFASWQHIILESNDFGSGQVTAYLNGTLLPAVSGSPYAGCGLNIGAGGSAANVPDNISTLKHLRMYGRTLDVTEIKNNAANPYFLPVNDAALYWYRTNIPEPGSITTIDTRSTDEFVFTPVFPNHRMPTDYTYNSTSQVVTQTSPDGGTNRYWYDMLSRLVISQNDKQNPVHDYAYTLYEPLGRISEVGQKKQTVVGVGNPGFISDSTQNAFIASGVNSQITSTYYDKSPGAVNGLQSVVQNNLRKRVAATTYRDLAAGPVQQASYYDYDLSGNVHTLYQQVDGLALKRMDYEYDLISGKVNFVAYQKNAADQFYYFYNYDAENRLTQAWSSPLASLNAYGKGSQLSPVKKRMDASYQYYLHGPLARMELGDVNSKVQGLDYAYTLQGWLKGVNRSIYTFQPNGTTDIGKDGTNGVAVDAYNYNLYYYLNDYKPVGAADPFEHEFQEVDYFFPMYNGNIAGMGETIPSINQPSMVNGYRYDQLNRLTINKTHRNNLPYDLPPYDAMDERFSYDGNGNIKTAFRHGDNFAASQDMDDLTYLYNRDAAGNLINNKLRHVNDAIPYYASGNPQDLHDQVTDNYKYDAIGNLISDQQGGVGNVDWTVYGKIKAITKTDGPSISYQYDAAGQRASKTIGAVTTWYVRDAQGNTMAVYDNKSGQVNWREQDLYGSSRLGTWEPNVNLANNNAATVWDTIGHKTYELTNHLGNVLVTISDKRLPHTTNGTNIDYYEAEVKTAQEYFAFGAPIPKRSYFLNNQLYRYGFNGKENDNEVKLDASGNPIPGSQQDYGMRIYDPRLGRFLSTDPIATKYPELTPYQFSSNSPVANIDLDGLEAARPQKQVDYFGYFIKGLTKGLIKQGDEGVALLQYINSKEGRNKINETARKAMKDPVGWLIQADKSITRGAKKEGINAIVDAGKIGLDYFLGRKKAAYTELGEFTAKYGVALLFPEERGVAATAPEGIAANSGMRAVAEETITFGIRKFGANDIGEFISTEEGAIFQASEFKNVIKNGGTGLERLMKYPIVAVEYKGQRYILDGHNRLKAFSELGRDVEVKMLSLDEARLEYKDKMDYIEKGDFKQKMKNEHE
jgi:RHS repeat-associated protein